ncbi:LysR family transcriptional regulator [Denitromonas iodatirespirans]|uniref:LysR family transcriptional regulator n=1 Tax=Denitromonas iodatirespirans TaxID=2795389 RepID=A0A944DD03_DENI1|nr:LysR family transcriptional regulator [Denitromonas iodatirespirans]MBT0963965.1 LysR family transcriptional regulator [Denitromonas iodatirespirans]
MKLSLDALAMLDAIDSAGSFAAAARQLYRVPSALTHAVRRLEDDLGFALFERVGRRARLTPAGRTLLTDGRQLLAAANELECRARRVATGWEVELRIALNALLPFNALLPLIAEFDAQGHGTRLRFDHEVLAGSWDALSSGRADLVVGASGEALRESALVSRSLGNAVVLFCHAPDHPLAAVPEPLPTHEIRKHRAVVLADTTRTLQARSAGLISGQDALIVPDFSAKLAAQVAGLGVGHLPPCIAQPAIDAGQLVSRQTETGFSREPMHLAWRRSHDGRALQWFVQQLSTPHWRSQLQLQDA